MEITPEKALAILNGYRSRPLDWVEDVYSDKLPLWNKQKDIIQAVFDHRNVSVKSCNSAGKSYIAARVAHAFLTLHPHSLVVSTAPTARQVRDVLWRYIGSVHTKTKYPMGGHLTQLGLEYDKDWYGVGLSTTEPEKFFGYHADHILVIADEASGVDENIYKGIRAITPNKNAHTLLIGNPTNPDGTFFQSFTDPKVKTFTISAFDTPNFTANNIHNVADLVKVFTPPEGVLPIDFQPELIEPYESLISPIAAYERLLEWGEDSPFFQALILGEFPSQAEASLIPLNLIQASMDADFRTEHSWNIPSGDLEYGVDVARFGMDKTVLVSRRGGHVESIRTWTKLDTSITTDRILDAMTLEDGHVIIRVDDTGVGGGVTDQLRRRKQGIGNGLLYTVIPINFGSGTSNPLKFYNKRAEMFWNLRERFFNHTIALPKDNELANELASMRYDFGGKEKNLIKIESKDDIKARLGHSPDKADALALAFDSQNDYSWPGDNQNIAIDPFARKDNQPITSRLNSRY